MRDHNDPAFLAGKALDDALGDRIAVPNDYPFAQLIWTTFVRSKRTYESISFLLGNRFDTQAAMLCRPLFEDMIVAHWLDLNRDDADWLVERFFRHRKAMALDQIEMDAKSPWGMGPPLVPDSKELRAQQNALGKEFKGRARRDWWDPCAGGRGVGSPIGVEGVAAILEDAALEHVRFDPRFAGGEKPLLRTMEAQMGSWFSRQLHHTAMGLPFQPMPEGRIEVRNDPFAALRILFTAYWIFGQQGFLLIEHVEANKSAYEQDFMDALDRTAYERTFMEGFAVIGETIKPGALREAPIVPYETQS
jgi:hypothetical protein